VARCNVRRKSVRRERPTPAARARVPLTGWEDPPRPDCAFPQTRGGRTAGEGFRLVLSRRVPAEEVLLGFPTEEVL
jgi:hypothetical protein